MKRHMHVNFLIDQPTVHIAPVSGGSGSGNNSHNNSRSNSPTSKTPPTIEGLILSPTSEIPYTGEVNITAPWVSSSTHPENNQTPNVKDYRIKIPPPNRSPTQSPRQGYKSHFPSGSGSISPSKNTVPSAGIGGSSGSSPDEDVITAMAAADISVPEVFRYHSHSSSPQRSRVPLPSKGDFYDRFV